MNETVAVANVEPFYWSSYARTDDDSVLKLQMKKKIKTEFLNREKLTRNHRV